MARTRQHPRQRSSPPQKCHPRVPAGARLVRQEAWWTTEHPDACWFRVLAHSPDWSQVRLQVAAAPDAAATIDFDVVIRPDGLMVPQQKQLELGAEALRVIGTAVRAAQRAAHDA